MTYYNKIMGFYYQLHYLHKIRLVRIANQGNKTILHRGLTESI